MFEYPKPDCDGAFDSPVTADQLCDVCGCPAKDHRWWDKVLKTTSYGKEN